MHAVTGSESTQPIAIEDIVCWLTKLAGLSPPQRKMQYTCIQQRVNLVMSELLRRVRPAVRFHQGTWGLAPSWRTKIAYRVAVKTFDKSSGEAKLIRMALADLPTVQLSATWVKQSFNERRSIATAFIVSQLNFDARDGNDPFCLSSFRR